jgi:hypothetical protein
MTGLFAASLTDWLAIVEWILIGAAAVVGAKVSHGAMRGSYRMLKRQPTWRAGLASRVTGGAGGGALVYLLFAGFGLGPGFGPGAGGLPGGGLGDVNRLTSPDGNATSPQAPSSQPADTKTPGQVLCVTLLGDRTEPKFEAPDKIFAIAEDAAKKALNTDGVIARASEMKRQRALKEVELILARDPDNPESSPSTTLANAAAFVDQLRSRVLDELRIPFRQPDPARPFKERILYEPKASGTAP